MKLNPDTPEYRSYYRIREYLIKHIDKADVNAYFSELFFTNIMPNHNMPTKQAYDLFVQKYQPKIIKQVHLPKTNPKSPDFDFFINGLMKELSHMKPDRDLLEYVVIKARTQFPNLPIHELRKQVRYGYINAKLFVDDMFHNETTILHLLTQMTISNATPINDVAQYIKQCYEEIHPREARKMAKMYHLNKDRLMAEHQYKTYALKEGKWIGPFIQPSSVSKYNRSIARKTEDMLPFVTLRLSKDIMKRELFNAQVKHKSWEVRFPSNKRQLV